ncbi:hypothetical protein, partial [Candidatus Venteria ishoeyi]|uniref:hypothetical protein n=1 Tax=Candidatus Venteria ishoeyi TaxID=1899563 RepID=UPI00255C9A12
MEDAKNYAGLILLIGLAAAATSLLMNLSFAASIGGSGLMLFVLVATWAVFDAAKLSVAYGVGWAWRQKKFLLSAFLIILVLVTTLLFSVFSGQAFLAGAFESVNQSRLQNSNEYKRQQTTLDSAERAATAAAVDSSSVQAAQANISTLESDKRQLLNGQAKNMAGNNAGTVQSRIGNCSGTGYYQRTYCPQLQDIN